MSWIEERLSKFLRQATLPVFSTRICSISDFIQVNNRIWADHIASKGDFLVYLPDFMDGKACSTAALEAIPKVMDNSLYGWLWKP